MNKRKLMVMYTI